ncbi:MAG UNVERIFIED_CONTAM: hypothetical protein LVQ98_05970 [Rickettsiaceae bacterium]|jgi:acyl-[acyl-carrier-protein]-phospholipid O-acyltransferase/long-chain-fatty-acid--[acyl-carrier-protein] ligase
MEHTCFSKVQNRPRIRFFPKVTITILPPVSLDVPEKIDHRQRRKYLSTKLYDIMCNMLVESSDYKTPIFQSLIDSSKLYGLRTKIIQDMDNHFKL